MTARWDMVGKPISTADMAAVIPTVFQPFGIPSLALPQVLKGIGVGLIFHASLFTNLTMEIWSDQGGSPAKLLATSTTTWTKAQIDAEFTTGSYRFSYVGFDFAGFAMKPGATYHLAVRATGYTGDDTNHIAWRHVYPDNPYAAEFSITPVEARKAAVMPYEAVIFAAEA